MNENDKNSIVEKGKNLDVEFSSEVSIGLDNNASVHQSAKDEIDKVKEFYESRL